MRYGALLRRVEAVTPSPCGLTDEALDAKLSSLLSRAETHKAVEAAWAVKDAQPFCDRCHGDLSDWSCYSWQRDGTGLKLCKSCAGY